MLVRCGGSPKLGAAAVIFDIAFPERQDDEAGSKALAAELSAFPHVGLVQMAGHVDSPAGPVTMVELGDARLREAAACIGTFVMPRDSGYPFVYWLRHPGLLEAGVQLPSVALALHAGKHSCDTAPTEMRILQHYGPPGAITSMGFGRLLMDELADADLAVIRDAVVFVGLQDLSRPQSADDLDPVFDGPGGVRLSGVETAAIAFTNLLHGQSLVAPSEGVRLGLVAGVTAIMVALAAIPPALLGSALAVGWTVIWLLIVAGAFEHAFWWLPYMVPLMALPPALLLAWIGAYRRAAGWLVYLPRSISRELLSGREAELGQRREMEITVMFLDIVNFTRFTESEPPERLSRLVEKMYEGVTALVETEGGTLHQQTGDGVIAYWGAPRPCSDHADRALRAVARVPEVIDAIELELGNEIAMRIGLNTGMATVGAIGGERTTFAAIGETMNIAQRLEQLGKEIGWPNLRVTALMSDATKRALTIDVESVDMGSFELRGLSYSTIVHQIRIETDQPELRRAG